MSPTGETLHLVPGHPFGGAQRVAIDLARTQQERGRRVRLVFSGISEVSRSAAARAGVPSTELIGGLQKRTSAAMRIMRNAALIHLHMPPPWLFAVLPSRRTLSAPVVLHLHARSSIEVHGRGLRQQIESRASRLLLRRVDRAVAITAWIATSWEERFGAGMPSVDVVANGVVLPCGELPTQAPRGPVIGMACRLDSLKGVEEFIDLAAAIAHRNPQAVFEVAGDGSKRAVYEELARARLGPAIRFRGFVDDMAKFWADKSLAAFTPPFEPFGLRLIEPVAHGVPVVAYLTDSGSDEIVGNCRAIAAVNYPETEALAERAAALLADPETRAKMASQGREDVESLYSMSAMAEAIETVYARAVESRRKLDV